MQKNSDRFDMFCREIPIILMKAVLSRYERIELFKKGEEKFMKVKSNVKAGSGGTVVKADNDLTDIITGAGPGTNAHVK
jgi:hypothetical protein